MVVNGTCALRACDVPHCSIQICVNISHGACSLNFATSEDRIMLLRIGGPHPQTVFFAPGNASSGTGGWRAPFRTVLDRRGGSRERHLPKISNDGQQWHALFRLCEPGTYTASVLLTMERPWDDKWYARCPIHHNASRATILRRHVWRHQSSASHSRHACTGLWHWRRHTSDGTQDEELSNQESAYRNLGVVALAPHPWRQSLHVRFRGLHFNHGKSMHWLKIIQRAAQRVPLCLAGDSHTRGLTNRLIALGDPTGQACDLLEAQKTKATCVSESFVNFKTLYPVQLHRLLEMVGANNKSELANCAALVVNVGQWSASYAGGMPWAVERYGATLEPVLRSLQRFGAANGVRVAWLSTSPYPLNSGNGAFFHAKHFARSASGLDNGLEQRYRKKLAHTTCPPGDWRFPHVLSGYNQQAAAVAAKYNVTFIDTWRINFDLFDLSYDNMHYYDPVALHVAMEVLYWLARDDRRSQPPSGETRSIRAARGPGYRSEGL